MVAVQRYRYTAYWSQRGAMKLTETSVRILFPMRHGGRVLH